MSREADPGSGAAPPALSLAPLPEPPPWAIRARYWAVVVAWMLLISYFSTDVFSAENTNRYLDPVLRWFFPDMTNPQLRDAHTVIRKSAHFIEFLVLGLLVVWAQRAGRPMPWLARWALNAMLLVTSYAGLDEFHQSFVASRTPSFADTAVDIFGGAVGQVALYLRHLVRSRR